MADYSGYGGAGGYGASGAGGAGGGYTPEEPTVPIEADPGALSALQAAEQNPEATGYPEEALAAVMPPVEPQPPPGAPMGQQPPQPAPAELAQVRARYAPTPQRRAAPPQAPPGLRGQSGGLYYAPDFAEQLNARRSEVENARLKDKISDVEASKRMRAIDTAEAAYRRHQQSLPGKMAQVARDVGEQQAIADEQQVQQAAVEAGTNAAVADEAQRALQWQQQERAGAQQRIELHQQAMQDIRDRVGKADESIAQTRIGDRRTGGQRAWDAIAAALGALGAGLTGTPDKVSDIIQQRIARDIDAQKEALASKRQVAGRLRNDLQAYEQQFGKGEQAQQALRARYLDEHARKLEQLGAQAKTELARSKALAAAKLLRQNQLVTEDNLQLGMAKMHAEQQAARQRAAAMAMQQRAQEAKRQQQLKSGMVEGWIDQKRANQYIPGHGFVDAPPEKVNELRTVMAYGSTLIEMGESIKQLSQKVSRFALASTSPEVRRLRSMVAQYTYVSQKASQEGVTKKEDVDMMQENVDPTSGLVRSTAPIDDMSGLMRVKMKNLLSRYHITPGVMQPMQTEKGTIGYYARMAAGVGKPQQSPGGLPPQPAGPTMSESTSATE